jgi:MYXO-CTERM domain-containing protein
LRRTAAVPGIAAVLIVGVLLYGGLQAAPAASHDGGLGVPAGSVAATATMTPETPADTPTPSPTPHFPVVFVNRDSSCAIVQSPAGGAWPLLIFLGLLALRRRSR